MNNSSLIQNDQNITNITSIIQLSNVTNYTINMTTSNMISPSPVATIMNTSISVILSPTGTQQVINGTNATNSPNASLNLIITPIYSPIPSPLQSSSPQQSAIFNLTERFLLDDYKISLNNPYVIGVSSVIILVCILFGFIINYLCSKKKNINKNNEDDKYILPSMNYSPKSPNHVKVRNILYR